MLQVINKNEIANLYNVIKEQQANAPVQCIRVKGILDPSTIEGVAFKHSAVFVRYTERINSEGLTNYTTTLYIVPNVRKPNVTDALYRALKIAVTDFRNRLELKDGTTTPTVWAKAVNSALGCNGLLYCGKDGRVKEGAVTPAGVTFKQLGAKITGQEMYCAPTCEEMDEETAKQVKQLVSRVLSNCSHSLNTLRQLMPKVENIEGQNTEGVEGIRETNEAEKVM